MPEKEKNPEVAVTVAYFEPQLAEGECEQCICSPYCACEGYS